jgi:ABC-type amino acid transport substrate-binding protein
MESNLSADIEVDLTKQLRGTARQKVVFWFFDLEAPEYYADGVSYNKASNQSSLFSFTSGLTDSVKAAAAYRAVAESKADLIVFPQYTIKAVSTFLGFYREITATVYGYPGTIKAIKPADVAKFNKKSAKE